MTTHLVIMGICGCGKTTVAQAMQQTLGCPYAEGDEFHTQANRDKMGAGTPLTDSDRLPWLHNLREWMDIQAAANAPYSIVTCSALKKVYRDILRQAQGTVKFIHLAPPTEEIRRRMANRQGHYMKADMVDSQLEILEQLDTEENGIKLDNSGDPAAVQAELLAWLQTA